jgi:DNA-binding response OmpR family regulator
LSGVRILVAEDENSILKLVTRYLENEGYSVLAASDGEEALDIWLDAPVDLAVLDVMMPKLDGWEVLKEIRKESDIPVIMLTARREEADRLQGFKLGTDDYLTKPFSPRELVMRVKALLKRAGKLSVNNVIELPGLIVNTLAKTVETPLGDAKLSAREYELLIYLIDNKGLVLTRDRLLERIWGFEYEGDTRVLDTTIKRLRAKLGSSGSCIKTLRGNGYMFEVHE